jgi:hypothetical protein
MLDIEKGTFFCHSAIEKGVISIYQVSKKKSPKDVSFCNLCLSGYLRPFMGDTHLRPLRKPVEYLRAGLNAKIPGKNNVTP